MTPDPVEMLAKELFQDCNKIGDHVPNTYRMKEEEKAYYKISKYVLTREARLREALHVLTQKDAPTQGQEGAG